MAGPSALGPAMRNETLSMAVGDAKVEAVP